MTSLASAAHDLQIDPGLNTQTLAAGFTGQPGDNRNALALGNLIDQPVLEGGKSTFNNVYSRIAAQVGDEVSNATADQSTAQATQQALSQASQSVSGVSTECRVM